MVVGVAGRLAALASADDEADLEEIGFAYPLIESGPCPCPSTVTCGTLCACDAGPACAACGGGQCVKTCTGGDNDGLARRDNDPRFNHCPGGTCGSGFCRDKCARCN